MKNIIYMLIAVLLLTGCNNSRNNKTEESSLGFKEKFVIKGFNIGVEIYLLPNYTFINRFYSRACMGGFYIKDVKGTYSLDGVNITFTPQTMVFMEDWESYGISNTTKIDTVAYYISDSTKIQTKYQIVELSDIKFLVSESGAEEHDDIFYRNSNFIALANLYNSNEQENTMEKLLANKDTVINFRKLDVSQNIPVKWKDYFLTEPIQAEITSVRVISNPIKIRGIEEDCGYTLIPTYKLNIGVQSGLKEGMILYSKKKKEIDVIVTQVNEQNSIAEGENIFYENTKFKVGAILSTRKD